MVVLLWDRFLCRTKISDTGEGNYITLVAEIECVRSRKSGIRIGKILENSRQKKKKAKYFHSYDQKNEVSQKYSGV